MEAGKLRHRVTIQQPAETQSTSSGAISTTWTPFASLWASIEPLSAREFVASQAEQSKISTRITIRRIAGITPKMRVLHGYSGKIYQIEGVLSDLESGLEYLTLPCSVVFNG